MPPCGASCCTASMARFSSASGSTGLTMKYFAPSAQQRRTMDSFRIADTMITAGAVSGQTIRSCSSTPSPSTCGMMRSSRRMSYLPVRSFSSASRPSAAVSTADTCSFAAKQLRMDSRKLTLSSTIRTRRSDMLQPPQNEFVFQCTNCNKRSFAAKGVQVRGFCRAGREERQFLNPAQNPTRTTIFCGRFFV